MYVTFRRLYTVFVRYVILVCPLYLIGPGLIEDEAGLSWRNQNICYLISMFLSQVQLVSFKTSTRILIKFNTNPDGRIKW